MSVAALAFPQNVIVETMSMRERVMRDGNSSARTGRVSDKRANGCYFTLGDPFAGNPVFERFRAALPASPTVVEPCAGAGHLARSFLRSVPDARMSLFDLVPRGADETECGLPVERGDSLADFPRGFDVCVMNPPYLSKVSARRLGVAFPETGLADLYEVALEGALRECAFVLAVIPGSFVVSGRFRERLFAVSSLPQELFGDTEHPVCLAAFGPDETDDHDVYDGGRLLGSARELEALAPAPTRELRVRFNVPTGEVAFRGADALKGRIGFYPGDFIDPSEVGPSSKFATRVELPAGFSLPVGALIERANLLLERYREATSDAGFRAFRDTRRRMTFGQARAFLSLAAEELEREARDAAAASVETLETESPRASEGLLSADAIVVGPVLSRAAGGGIPVGAPASLEGLRAGVADDVADFRLVSGAFGRGPWAALERDDLVQGSGDFEIGFYRRGEHVFSPFSFLSGRAGLVDRARPPP